MIIIDTKSKLYNVLFPLWDQHCKRHNIIRNDYNNPSPIYQAMKHMPLFIGSALADFFNEKLIFSVLPKIEQLFGNGETDINRLINAMSDNVPISADKGLEVIIENLKQEELIPASLP